MSRIFALIPAAGHSRRMQAPKLLLPVHGRRVIDHLLDALIPSADAVFILVRRSDTPLKEALTAHPAVHIVEPASDPPEMRSSVELLLDEVALRCSPAAEDGWLLTPADHPVVHPGVVQDIISHFAADPEAIHIPTFNGRGGHPTLFPWSFARRVKQLPQGEGLNSFRRLPGVRTSFHPTDEPSVLWDLDTPEDYQRLLTELSDRQA
jgi:molybdenum cofactor cytidylyltransferase